MAASSSRGPLGSHEDASRSCRPFDRTRNGFVPGEGAGFLVLKSAEVAAGRDARVLARLRGWATGLERSGRIGLSEDGSGILAVMRQALEQAGLDPDEIEYINAHGTGTRAGDRSEARAVATLFGPGKVCGSTKPVTGHCMGATPVLEAILTIQALRERVIPPTANCLEPDEECPVDPLPGRARPERLRAVVSNSVGFWGFQASLVLSEFHPATGLAVAADVSRRQSPVRLSGSDPASNATARFKPAVTLPKCAG
jgi:3-oxoacyl-(acyl-carrier-protein) synthase